MACCSSVSKCVLAIINLVFMLAACALIAVGAWIFADYSHYRHLTADIGSALLPACILLAVGIILFLLGFVGCFASFREQKCLIGLYFSLLLVLFIGCAGGIVTAYFFRSKIDRELHDAMKEALDQYNTNGDSKYEVDTMQKELKCCGVDNFTDWEATEWYKNQTDKEKLYPESCCKDNNCTYRANNATVDHNLYGQGCYTLLKQQFLNHFSIIGGVAIGCTVILLIGMICSCILLCRRQSEIPYIGFANPDGLRV